MALAYRVKYRNPEGRECPDAIIVLDGGFQSSVADIAKPIESVLLEARGGSWDRITIESIELIGPWFGIGIGGRLARLEDPKVEP